MNVNTFVLSSVVKTISERYSRGCNVFSMTDFKRLIDISFNLAHHEVAEDNMLKVYGKEF